MNPTVKRSSSLWSVIRYLLDRSTSPKSPHSALFLVWAFHARKRGRSNKSGECDTAEKTNILKCHRLRAISRFGLYCLYFSLSSDLRSSSSPFSPSLATLLDFSHIPETRVKKNNTCSLKLSLSPSHLSHVSFWIWLFLFFFWKKNRSFKICKLTNKQTNHVNTKNDLSLSPTHGRQTNQQKESQETCNVTRL